MTLFTLLCSVAGFACAKGVRLPDEQSEELCEAKSQEVERRSPLTHTHPLYTANPLHTLRLCVKNPLPLYTLYMLYTAKPLCDSAPRASALHRRIARGAAVHGPAKAVFLMRGISPGSSFMKAKHFLPRSLRDAPMR